MTNNLDKYYHECQWLINLIQIKMTKNTLGIIAGGGMLPSEIANLCIKNGRKCCIAAIEGEAKTALLNQFMHKEIPIGRIGDFLDYFIENKVDEIIIIGGISRPDLKSINVDMTGSKLIAKILKNKLLGDDTVLQVITKFIESRGFSIVSPTKFLKTNAYEQLYQSKNAPSNQDEIDIEIGKKVLECLGNIDVGQSIIVCDGYVLGIEAAEGTDELIRRCEFLRKREIGGVLVKIPKSHQDLRLDMPTIGPDTMFYLAKHGYRGVAIKKSEVIIVKPQETIDLINEHKLFLAYI